MKIDKSVEIQPAQDAVLRSGHNAVAARPAGRAGAHPHAATDTDSVSLSNVPGALSAAGDEAGVRPEKVAEIREAIREGRFHVRAEVIAERMIAQAAELLETLAASGR
ncbi:MAG: flagellar biosynthesis anti-sigma factor FlgM [Burkholderiales bacterium]|nr:flagellar biosynthesis anti-sigma factor FlgM [Burkholderiales bacterium]MEB2353084.1 flagellar biosynthesis anti-sigma factor FlgM [Burkholderiaceae bacterium]HMM51039.1 flagellar biosynthesis anti-sigma factor FlgM [Burkholderiaceae bacterium]